MVQYLLTLAKRNQTPQESLLIKKDALMEYMFTTQMLVCSLLSTLDKFG